MIGLGIPCGQGDVPRGLMEPFRRNLFMSLHLIRSTGYRVQGI